MKESKLIEMQKHIEILGRAVNRALGELEQLKTLSVGNMEMVKLLPGYEDALKVMIEKQKESEAKADEPKLDLDNE